MLELVLVGMLVVVGIYCAAYPIAAQFFGVKRYEYNLLSDNVLGAMLAAAAAVAVAAVMVELLAL